MESPVFKIEGKVRSQFLKPLHSVYTCIYRELLEVGGGTKGMYISPPPPPHASTMTILFLYWQLIKTNHAKKIISII